MTESVELPVEPFIKILPTASVSEALNALEASRASYAVICDANQPKALLSQSQLTQLEQTRILADLPELPPLLVVDANKWTIKRVKQISDLLKKNKAWCGLIIYQQSEISGVISRTSVAKALPIKISERIYGDPQVPLKTYICRKCNPPTYSFPRQGNTPTCPKDLSHNLMEEESV